MCVVCGCGETSVNGGGQENGHEVLQHGKDADLHFGNGPARVSVPGMSQTRAIRLEQDVLGENNRYAQTNRKHFSAHGILALNLMSGPGAGKTTLLCATIEALRKRAVLPIGVIEGDQQTNFDAERIRASGAAAIQVNTGKGCHLDAQMVAAAFGRLPLHVAQHGQDGKHGHGAHVHGNYDHSHQHDHSGDYDPGQHHSALRVPAKADAVRSVLFIENVGNLVCPAMWDLGEAAKVVIMSVSEGEDKPLKYPDMFSASGLMIVNKIDLLPHIRFDVKRCIDYALRVNPHLEILELSAQTGEGLDAWVDWILDAVGRGTMCRYRDAAPVGMPGL
ncbi:Hydrogenase nickel incorporation protein HypB [Paraburkholderia ribeironis]|uniref:Hydrogenase maturation factor HypB n=1 Tax=Paraburkholderia ribeironis TaxID=1247936 RepID=A0A1N7RT10_9BURK|nr:hydrogenase nickel incorporation protein HypB [Paraburkholderia ribeironis]SIT38245.1 Hydrogenase nickel incorporation protein HypB [Paraburkholderia ribeironis]